MIYLITATPGSGKTLWAVNEIFKRVNEADPWNIFSNIDGLRLDTAQPLKDKFEDYPARTLAQSLIEVTQFDLTGKKLSQKFYNKAWTCELKQGFIVKNQRLLIDTQCAEKSNFDEYGDMIDPQQNKSYQIEVK